MHDLNLIAGGCRPYNRITSKNIQNVFIVREIQWVRRSIKLSFYNLHFQLIVQMLGIVDIAKRKKSAKRQIEKIIGISRQNITVCLRRTVIDTVQVVRVNFMLRRTYRFHRVIHRVNHTDNSG